MYACVLRPYSNSSEYSIDRDVDIYNETDADEHFNRLANNAKNST